MFKLIIFDLDGTITESKSKIDREMSRLISRLLRRKKVAVISGGSFAQFKLQFLPGLAAKKDELRNLYIFPTNSTSLYIYKGVPACRQAGWRRVYEEPLIKREKQKIMRAFKIALREINYSQPPKIYGPVIEDRKTQITFSALGQRAPVPKKLLWNKKSDSRPRIMRALKKHLKGFEIRRGGLTSIDITRRGINKAYGVRRILKYLKIKKNEAVFVGDALYPGGNDEPARRAGVKCIIVSGPIDVKKLIRKLLN